MTTEQFTYWIHGFFEISESKQLTEKQTQIIKDHLALVFNKVTPDRTENSGAITHELPGTIECEKNWSEILSKSFKSFTPHVDESDINPPLCNSLDSNTPICQESPKFGLGKFNRRPGQLYC